VSVPVEELARLPLLREYSPALARALAPRAVEAKFSTGTVMFLAGSAPRGWYIILEGCVRVVRGNGARQHVIHTETAGGTRAEVPMFGGTTHPATGIAAEPTRCAIFDRQALEAAMRECPEIGFLINRRLALRVKRLVDRLDERSRSVATRLAEFLLLRAETSPSGRFSIGMTQQALAEELGTVREVVSREIRSLVKAGMIKRLGGGRFELRDPERLRSRVPGL
jgi:CRP/FNR family transcriptional regulator